MLAYYAADWDEALSLADQAIPAFEAESADYLEFAHRMTRSWIRLARGELASALADAERALAIARTSGDWQILYPALACLARVRVASSDESGAAARIVEVLASWRVTSPVAAAASALPDVAVACSELARTAELLDAAAGDASASRWLEAMRLFAAGDEVAAADVYGEIGTLPDEAYARLCAAERLAAAGRRGDADTQLRSALAFFTSVKASAYVRRGERLLAASA